MTNEEHGMDFLEYVAANEKQLKKNLRKNITYNEEIFDDVFQTTIIKVYNHIIKGNRIDDFEKYFFIASKWEYIAQDNKRKKKLINEDNTILWDISHGAEQTKGTLTTDGQRLLESTLENDDEYTIREQRYENINKFFKLLGQRLNEVYRPDEVDIFLIYYRLKAEKQGISYKKMSKITDKSVSEISSIIQKIKNYIKNDEELNDLKKKMIL